MEEDYWERSAGRGLLGKGCLLIREGVWIFRRVEMLKGFSGRCIFPSLTITRLSIQHVVSLRTARFIRTCCTCRSGTVFSERTHVTVLWAGHAVVVGGMQHKASRAFIVIALAGETCSALVTVTGTTCRYKRNTVSKDIPPILYSTKENYTYKE